MSRARTTTLGSDHEQRGSHLRASGHGRLAVAARLLLAAYAVVLVVVLLWPRGSMPTSALYRVAFFLYDLGVDPRLMPPDLVEPLANVVILVPPALLARLSWPAVRWWVWGLAGLGFSLAVETSQMVFLAERTPSLVDVGANTAGAFLGALLPGTAYGRARAVSGPG